MPTVEVIWMGQCTDRKIQKALCKKVSALGRLSCQMYNDFFGQKLEPVIYEGKTRLEKVLMERSLLPEGVEASAYEEVDQRIVLLRDVRFWGVEFPLFDPRRYNSIIMLLHAYNISFVFLRSANPLLDGRLVKVRPIDPEKEGTIGCSFYLGIPQIDLRYYLERWSDRFLGWVKHFYIPDLFYWNCIKNPGDFFYEKIDPTNAQARNRMFKGLCNSFSEEAKSFTNYCNSIDPNASE